jgi:hypothetical protein
MKKLTLMFPLLIMFACGKAPLVTQGTPVATQGPPACSGANFPIKKGSSSSCAPTGSAYQPEVWHVIGTQGGGGLAHRYLGPACTSRKTTCGNALFFGPCGAALDPNEDPAWVDGRNATVFFPAAGHGVGFQVTTYYGQYSNTVLNPENPEPYTGQPLYPPVVATCPFTACIGPGIPAIEVTLAILSLNVPAGTSLGRVLSDPPGITLQGSGEASGLFPGDVTLIAEPTGKHVRAVFSGDCKKAGEYGQRAECIVKLAPDPKVTVTFECEKGFTCGSGGKD